MKNKLLFFLSAVHGALIVVSLMAMVHGAVHGEDLLYYWVRGLVILVPFALTFFAANWVKHLITYLIIGVFSVALMVILPYSFVEKLILAILSVLLVLVRMGSRVSNTENILDIPAPAGALLFVFLFIVSVFLKNEELQNLLYWLGFGYVVLLFLYMNFSHLRAFMHEREETANLPVSLMKKTNRRMLSLFLLVTILMMLIIPLLPVDKIAEAAGKAVKAFFAWLASFAPEAQEAVETMAESAPQEAGGPMMLPEASPTPRWLEIIQEVLFRLFSSAVLIALAAGIGMLIYNLFKRFYRPRTTTFEEDSTGDEKELLDFSAKGSAKAQRESFFDRFKPNAWVRRFYRKSLLKSLAASGTKADNIPSSSTPSELEAYCRLPADEERTAVLHALYEKARYSETGCTSEDVSRLRELK